MCWIKWGLTLAKHYLLFQSALYPKFKYKDFTLSSDSILFSHTKETNTSNSCLYQHLKQITSFLILCNPPFIWLFIKPWLSHEYRLSIWQIFYYIQVKSYMTWNYFTNKNQYWIVDSDSACCEQMSLLHNKKTHFNYNMWVMMELSIEQIMFYDTLPWQNNTLRLKGDNYN